MTNTLPTASDRPFDVIVYGATGFTGRQAASYLAAHAPAALRWTLAGRRIDALRQLAEELGLSADPLVADSTEPASLDALAQQTRVLLSTAGPYAKYGGPVVQACVDHRTHYVDITGESPWVAGLIARHHERALADGTRIVPFCGFDSIPSDLGARLMVRALRDTFNEPTARIVAAFSLRGGGLNGGTLASALNLAEQFSPRELADPFLLCPGETTRAQWQAHRDPQGPVFDPARERWMAPFVMGPVNTRVVRRSAHLFAERGEPYGPRFAYQEYMDVSRGRRRRALTLTAGLGIFVGAMRSGVGRALFRRFGPKPGDGPSEAAMERGSFRVWYRAESDGGRCLQGSMVSPGDAGNVSTVRFCCESALALATQAEALGIAPGRGGVLTPAVAVGDVLLERLQARGVEWSVADPAV
ncbi:MAG: saccharopine dehydrogenase [Deltaproteobacteria bacterium]|nr:MAG: saccharopine dehydrogenase [Deltaproteobacteria bacterium]